MKIVGMEKLSLVDYDGHCAVTLFTSKCMYRCHYCHNAPLIEGVYDELDHSEIFAHLEKRRKIISAVVISGGEPTLEPDLEEFIRSLKANFDVKVKLDTAGINPDVVSRLVSEKLIDYVAMDIKSAPLEYGKITAVQNSSIDKVMKTVELLKQKIVDYEFRTTLVREFHTEQVMQEIAVWLMGAKRYYLQKLITDEMCYCDTLTPCSKEQAEQFRKIMLSSVEDVQLRSY